MLTVPPPSMLEGRTLGEAALQWASLAWPVFPVQPRGKAPYGAGEFCGREDDHLCGFHCATADPERIAAWWDAHPDANIGIASPTAVFVDEDRLGALHAAGVKLPRCPWATTGRAGGGRHFFLRAPKGWAGLGGDDVTVTYRVPAVEIKGFDKGYVVAAPSIHATGDRYRVEMGGYVPEIPLAVLDQLSVVESALGPTNGHAGFVTVAGGGYELPVAVGEGGRYEAIRAYVAHLYNRLMTVDEMWPLVRTLLAPRFTDRLSERDLRDRFKRATEDLEKRLGEPRGRVAATAAAVPTAFEDAALTEFDSRPIEWLWPAWLPRGVVTLMDGNPGVSKSTLVADLVARITTGTPWPDGAPATTPPGRVMWITTEDDPGRVLRPRIEAAGGDASLVRFVTSEVVFPGAEIPFRELTVARAAEPLGLALVILDPLFSHIDAKVKSIADAEMRQGVMNPLNRVAEAARVGILVVRHYNKDVTASALNRGAGSLGGIVGAARALWSVTLDPEDETGETKAVGVAKLNYARAKPPLRYKVVDRVPPGWIVGTVSGIEWLGEAAVSIDRMVAEKPGVGDAMAALEEILGLGLMPAKGVESLMRSRGFGRDATRSAAARLRIVKTKAGMTGGWTWALPEESSEESGSEVPDSSDSSGLAPARAGRDSSPDSSDSSGASRFLEESEELPTGAPPARTRTREARPVESWCQAFADHQLRHRDVSTDSPWCEVCTPRGAA